MSKWTWSKWTWADWERDPALRRCGFAAKGLWMDMLCLMDAGEERGFLTVNHRAATNTEIARMLRADARTVERLIGELEANGVFSRDDRLAVYSRRMLRDASTSRMNAENGSRGGNPQLKKNKELGEIPVNQPVKAREEVDIDKNKRDKPLPSKAPSAKADAPAEPPLVFPDWLPIDAWRDFVEHRKQMRKPMTPNAKRLLIQKLGMFHAKGIDVAAALNASTTNGWTGVFEPKEQPASPQYRMAVSPGAI